MRREKNVKLLALLLSLALACGLCACGGTEGSGQTKEESGSNAELTGEESGANTELTNEESETNTELTDGETGTDTKLTSGEAGADAGQTDGASGADAEQADGASGADAEQNGGATEADAELINGASSDEGARQASSTVYPVTVTDQLGREVTIAQEPETIVSGYYISTSLLIALGLADKLVGVEAKADSRPIYQLSAPAILSLPSVGTAKAFDLEGCAALEPDLVILPAKLKDTIPSLEDLGFTVLAVNPESRELLEEAAALLGTATDTADRAEALLGFAADHLAALQDALSGTETPSVCLTSNSALLSVAGPAMYQNDLILQSGGSNAAAEIQEDYWAEISYEQLLAWNPDYLILAADADYTVESVLSDPNLADLKAVQDGCVYQLPGSIEAWDSPVPGTVLGSLWLASILHPEQFPASSWQEAVVTFYETFYGFTPDMDTLQ